MRCKLIPFLVAIAASGPVVAAPNVAIVDPGRTYQNGAPADPEWLSMAADQITAAAMNKTTKCHLSQYTLGTAGLEIPVTMTTSADGWCWTTPRTRTGAGYSVTVSQPPSHGQGLVVVEDGGRDRFAYKPADGYVGPDHVKLSLVGGSKTVRNYILDITIDVQGK